MSISQQKPLNIVAVSGGLNHPSKTEALVQAILDELGEATPINVHFIKFSEIGHLLGGAIYRNQLPQRVQDDLAAVEAADALIVGTPVYRASFTGLFKHFFDFVEQTALVDVPVLLGYNVMGDMLGIFLGPVASYNLSSDNQFNDFKENAKDDFTVGYQFGAQLQLQKFIINGRYEGAFTDDQRDFINTRTNQTIRYDSRPSMLILGLGYQF